MSAKVKIFRFLCCSAFCVLLSACGRAGALVPPPDHVQPPPAHGEVQSSGQNRRGSILQKIRPPRTAPLQKSVQKPAQETSPEKK